MHSAQHEAVFEYLDTLGCLWEKSITEEKLSKLEADTAPILLEKLEFLLPRWELNINRHLVLHLVCSIRANGPCWTWCMFVF